ncbi:MAG: hypothetical protein ACLPR9_10730 [Acidimicrobiales bacterium]|jgi:transposase-like protein
MAFSAPTAFFAGAIRSNGEPAEVTTDRAHTLVRIVAELLPAALHDTTQYANYSDIAVMPMFA